MSGERKGGKHSHAPKKEAPTLQDRRAATIARTLAQELARFLEGQDRLWPDSLDLQRTMLQTKAKGRHHDEAPAAVVPANPVRR
ncbi:MAG TPA: hypothetical protein VNP04_20020 [Alphaproteobacteria bacterium]|nr:hypothetical protein [Alphaproteobacteria bacterium]